MSKGGDKRTNASNVVTDATFRIGVLLYFGDAEGRLLLMQRQRQPNRGLWCAVGGKLEMPTGESPYECAIREAREEVGVELTNTDLALRGVLSEKYYEGSGHWLMFIFEVLKPLEILPESIEEGVFEFFELESIESITMPELDKRILLERILGDDTKSLYFLRAPEGSSRDPDLLVEEARIGMDQ